MSKPKKCKICGTEFHAARLGQKVCSPGCAIKYVTITAAQKKRKESLAQKKSIQTYSERKSKAQKAVNRYVRARDRWRFISQDKMPECISCGTTNPTIQYCAGHYKTRGSSPELALNPKNIHLQCNFRCNSKLSANIHGTKDTRGYIAGIIAWYGEKEGREIIEYLDGQHDTKKYLQSELHEIQQKYNRLALEIERKIKNRANYR